MTLRNFALVYGVVFIVVGLAGFVPALVAPPVPEGLAVTAGGGYLFGLFPINVLHNLVHLGFGVWGLVAYRTAASARLYAQAVAVIYGVLVIMGFIPLLRTTFGLIPLFGHDIWLHAVLAGIAAYFGFSERYAPSFATTTTRTSGLN
jgi:hypothetical protein